MPDPLLKLRLIEVPEMPAQPLQMVLTTLDDDVVPGQLRVDYVADYNANLGQVVRVDLLVATLKLDLQPAPSIDEQLRRQADLDRQAQQKASNQ
jgi:hypothetical protein